MDELLKMLPAIIAVAGTIAGAMIMSRHERKNKLLEAELRRSELLWERQIGPLEELGEKLSVLLTELEPVSKVIAKSRASDLYQHLTEVIEMSKRLQKHKAIYRSVREFHSTVSRFVSVGSQGGFSSLDARRVLLSEIEEQFFKVQEEIDSLARTGLGASGGGG